MKVILDTFLREINDKTTENNQYPVLTSSKAGIFLQSDYFNKQVASRDNTGYKVIRRRQFTYRAMSDTGEFFPNMLDCADIGIVSPAYPVFEIAKPGVIIPEFLKYYFKSDVFQHSIASFAQGSTRTSIKFEKLKSVSINLPNIERQVQIIGVLDKVSKLIYNRTWEIQKLDELIKARFVEMFGKQNPSWPIVTIGEICRDTRTGPFGSALHHDEFVDDGIFVLGIDNAVENKFSYNRMRYITEEKYQQLKRYTVHPGDVIITIMGTIGRSAVIPDDIPLAINTKHLACLTPDYTRVNSEFLCSAFQMHPDVQRQLTGNAKGAIMDGLNLGIIKGLKFQLPPLQMQEDFQLFYAQIDKSKSAIQKSLDETQLLFDSLMQQYFG